MSGDKAVICTECKGKCTILNPYPTRTHPEIVCPKCGGYGTTLFPKYKPSRWYSEFFNEETGRWEREDGS